MSETTRIPGAPGARVTGTRDDVADAGQVAGAAGADSRKLHAIENSLTGKVYDSPIKALLIAAGVGLLFGCRVRRR